ncbi:MAG: YicC/YloC family endoribonuclease [Candidatus Rifleibacteriota bacterium]
MISSLTGFGRASFTDEAGRISVELKSVNNRFLQLDLHLPYGFNWVDGLVRQLVSSQISRGKVYLHLEAVDYNPNQDVIINKPLLKKLVDLSQEVSAETGRQMPVALDGLLSLPGVMKVDAKVIDNDQMWQRIKPVVDEALANFIAARRREGENLARDLRQRSDYLKEALNQVETRIPEIKQQFATRFKERITELAEKAGVDESRLNTEIAIWVDRSDVSEEITRLRSHLQEFDNILNSDKPIGRRLDFLVQEINREANTLGSKTSDVSVTQTIIDIKCEIEKIREQAQNIE